MQDAVTAAETIRSNARRTSTSRARYQRSIRFIVDLQAFIETGGGTFRRTRRRSTGGGCHGRRLESGRAMVRAQIGKCGDRSDTARHAQ
jgi:hypothetical protein